MCNINEITRDSFKKEAIKVGIGVNMTMKRFDALTYGFKDAIYSAKEELENQGFDNVGSICDEIMKKCKERLAQ